MKKIFIFVLFGLFALNTQAQFSIGATVGPQIPLGDFGKAAKVGFGFNIAPKYIIQEHLALGLNFGMNFHSSKLDGTIDLSDLGGPVYDFKTSFSTMPITALVEYHIGKGKVQPYVGADVGLYRMATKVTMMGVTASTGKMYFGFAPTAGALFNISEKISICGNAKFHVIMSEGSTSTFLGINVGAFYTLK